MPLLRYPTNGEEILLITYRCFPEKFTVMQYKLPKSPDMLECTIYAADSLMEKLQATIGKDIEEKRLKLPMWMRIWTENPVHYRITGSRLEDWK